MMKTRTLIKILLLLAGGLSVLSVIMQNETLELVVKPMTVPLFFMLYWFNVKKVDVLFLVVLFFCFLGDVFLLVQLENSFILVLLSYIVCYLILFYYLFIGLKAINFKSKDSLFFVVFLVVWTTVVYMIYDVIHINAIELQAYIIMYELVLYFLLIGAVFRYFNNKSSSSLWFVIAVFNFFISDGCYALDKFYVSSIELKVINAIYQLLAVYFLVRFKLANNQPLSFVNNEL